MVDKVLKHAHVLQNADCRRAHGVAAVLVCGVVVMAGRHSGSRHQSCGRGRLLRAGLAQVGFAR